MIFTDVTDRVSVGEVDGDTAPLTKCLCGRSWPPWDGPLLGIYLADPTACPYCGARFFFVHQVTVMQVVEDTPHVK